MKKYIAWLVFACILSINVCFSQKNASQATVIYLVRHAEKDLSNAADKDPPLSDAGNTRAAHLAEKLKNEKISEIYSTDFKRTRSTVKPLADRKKLNVKLYQGQDYEEIKKMLRADAGKTIVICGHSNTLLPMIEALDAKPPLEKIDENEYDNLFKLVIQVDETVTVSAEKYN